MTPLLELVRRHHAGERCGIYSVCSAHPLVLRAALEHARDCDDYALIEATSNQVNQEGGYTGLRPAQFRAQVLELATACGLDPERVLLGGDHLGPNPWRALPAKEALERARSMVDEYVSAGYRKIHLDCSMSCAGDPVPLTDSIVAARSARLCAAAEAAWQRCAGAPPVYVIGTEVPTPGGAPEALGELAVTEPAAAAATLAAHRQAFLAQGLTGAWERVIALVVQPGVEFDHDRVVEYSPVRSQRLSASIEQFPHLVFEAHSTDYQSEAALTALVRDHFAILKVGPAATFAMREALWALDRIEREWHGDTGAARLPDTTLAAMHRDPRHWRAYYHHEGRALDLHLQYSLSDRIRYYWTDPQVAAAVNRLRTALLEGTPPIGLLSQYLPSACEAVRSGALPIRMNDLVVNHVRRVLARYSRACDGKHYDSRGKLQ